MSSWKDPLLRSIRAWLLVAIRSDSVPPMGRQARGASNGRMGRLWHTLLLYRYHPAFEFVPLESIIRERQKDYYAVLGNCGSIYSDLGLNFKVGPTGNRKAA